MLRVLLALLALLALVPLCLTTAEADDVSGETMESATREDPDTVLTRGREVFHRKCVKCHGSGRRGAPAMNRPDEWARRLQQPATTLVDHALNGHRGTRGRMPPKGGFPALSDEAVEAAVAYMVARAELLVSRTSSLRVACGGRREEDGDCVPAQSRDGVLLRLLWALTESSRDR